MKITPSPFAQQGALLGFFGAAPVARPAAYTQTFSTQSRTMSATSAANAPAGGTGATAGAYDTAANRNLAITAINNDQADLDNLKRVVTQIIDDLQSLGILQ